MADDRPVPTAQILAFRPRHDRTEADNRFTLADRAEALRWAAGKASGIRLTIHGRLEDDPPEVGEFASIYPPGGPWAAWGAVRQGRNISVWRARDGRDLGRFPTMSEALAAVPVTRRKS